MTRRQGYRFRLKPNPAEASLLRQFVGCSRFVWNAILAENQARFEMGDPLKVGYAAFCERLQTLKARHDFLRGVHSQPLQQTLRDLAGAYQRAFNPKLAAELPTFKKKANAQGIRFPQGFKVERNGVFLPKIGWVAFRVTKRTARRKVLGEVKNVTVRLEAQKWYVSFQTEREVPEPIHENAGSAVGIDVGVARFAALSDDTFCEGANAFQKHERRLAVLQRRLARKVKFSANWRKAKARITAIHWRIANIRKDQIHKASATISKNHAVVVMEDLRIANMTASAARTIEEPGRNVAAKSGLNRRILDQGWGELRRQIGQTRLARRYAAARRSAQHVPHLQRLQTRQRRNRVTQSAFECLECGHASNADTNAAKNILGRAGQARIACGDSKEFAKQEALCVA